MPLPLLTLSPYMEALVIGLVYGLLFCTSSCLPYIASYIAAIGAGFRKGIILTLTYNSGRIIAYALIGAAIAIFKLAIGSETLATLQIYSSIAFAIVTIAIGASLLFQSKKPSTPCKNCITNEKISQPIKRINEKFDFRAFSLGLSRGMIICPPLLLLLVNYAATTAAPIDSINTAILFGIGTAISPTLLLLGGITGWLLTKAPLYKKWITIIGGMILIIFGASTLVSTLLVT
jgi:sulfite exporter TauE/SafE